ncbi:MULTISPECIES: hypothetical protein [Moorena]|uniref:Uncharacterized protein n=1 Tax=Moorena producens 3L TaxID=489825 RepID=F4Y170_9CYAN|nr:MULTISPECIES: hypothetical protein [Moorena]EGJ29581.1 hypothetical protein LYNGBM3L_62580 [Moorena producens 3L]OLT68012.1 hypothetical protein BI334_25965 [Moorena producens 3L]
MPAQRIDHPTDIKGLEIPYPVVLKSQVSTYGDNPARRIRCVEQLIRHPITRWSDLHHTLHTTN